jgi:DNA-binding beta-propeller fold protein YncE
MRPRVFGWLRTVGSVFLVAGFVAASNTGPQAPVYRLLHKVTLGGEGGWDYFDVDPDSNNVFIPRDTHTLVVNLKGEPVADIPGVQGAHAIAFAPGLRKAFLSTEGSVSVLDLRTLKIAAQVPLPGKDPDAILYDASIKRIFTFNGGGTEDATAIDASTGKVLGNIALGGKPETAQADGSGHVYVNVEDKNKIVAFDSQSLRTLASWPVAPCEEPAGLAIDIGHRRLFAGCHNQLMAVVDYTNGKVVATVPIGKGVDANRFDPGTSLAFASCGDGTITVAHEDSPDHYRLIQTIRTQRGARTMTLDLKTHRVIAVSAEFGAPPKATPEKPHPHPTVISKTFTMLVFGQ